jgi:hypothetical protein
VSLRLAISPSSGLDDLGTFPLWFQRLDHRVARPHRPIFATLIVMRWPS